MAEIRAALRPAGLSLDLDNRWSYLRSQGDNAWRTYPSFLATVIPRILSLFAELDLKATVFVVGRDADEASHAAELRALHEAGHELGNHSWDHATNFHQFDEARIDADLAQAESALERITGVVPRGFRAPSFGINPALIQVLQRRGYHYDSSLWPTSVGPLARAWERLKFRAPGAASATVADRYGSIGRAWLPLTTFAWRQHATTLIEIPVTTMPYCRLPVHWTYLNFLADLSPAIARAWLQMHIRFCLQNRLAPQLLIHTTDLLGKDDPEAPHFMPGMKRSAAEKGAFLRESLDRYKQHFALSPIHDYVRTAVVADALESFDPGATLT